MLNDETAQPGGVPLPHTTFSNPLAGYSLPSCFHRVFFVSNILSRAPESFGSERQPDRLTRQSESRYYFATGYSTGENTPVRYNYSTGCHLLYPASRT